MRRLQIFLGLVALALLGSDQALVGTAGELEAGDRWQTRLRLFASRPTLAQDESRQGALKVRIPSFGLIGRQGDLYLPIKTIRIAIPESTGEVRLEALRADPVAIEGLLLDEPSAPGRRIGTRRGRPQAPDGHEARGRGPRGSGGPGKARAEFAPPAEPIRLGDVGYLRDQRFVEISYTPVVAPEGGGEALFYGEVEVDIIVEGVPPAAVKGTPASLDPLFEEIYRNSFSNYEQGRYIRAPGDRSARPESAEPAVGGLTGSSTALEGAGIESNGFPDYKLFLSADGIYRLSEDYLLAPGTGVAPGLAGADPRQFKIMNRGVEIAIHVEGESDGSFDPGDYIEFYGQRLDGPETLLNYDMGLLPSIFQHDDYGDENVYWLSVDGSGTRSRVPARSAPPNGSYALEADFEETLHFELDSLYQPTGGGDPFLMSPRLNSNNGSVPADPNTCVYTNPGVPSQPGGSYLGPVTDPNDPHHCPVCRMDLPGINGAAAGTATVAVQMRGTTDEAGVDPDRLSVVEANGVPSESSAFCWSGLDFATQTLDLPHSSLTDPLDIRIELPGLAATSYTEQMLLDWTEVTYRRLFEAIDDGLRFGIPDQDRRIAVSDLSTGDTTQISLYEITGTIQPLMALGGPAIVAPVRITGGSISGGGGSFTLTFTNEDDPNSAVDRIYEIAGPGTGGLQLPDRVEEDVPSTLIDPTNEADVLVIGDPNLMDPSPSSPFSSYWSHRATVDGLVVQVVSIGDVDDEFGYGLRHPEAIRAFLDYAYDNWKGPGPDPNRAPPAFVTLVGDMTADPKNNLGRSDWVNQVPGFMMYQKSAVLGFYVSDNYIAAFRGADQLPDVHLGRLPVRTPAEADTVFTKLLNYESPPAGDWQGRGLFITDEGKSAGESSEFERITNDVVNIFWQPQPPHQATKIYYDEPEYGYGNDPNQVRDDINAAIDGGAALLQYTGHGAFSIWGVDGWYHNSDAAALTANGKYFFGVNENCLAGGFHFLGSDALSEVFLKAEDKGAIAFFAPAGLSFSFIGESINYQIYGDIFGTARLRRFGPLISNVRTMLGSFGAIIDQQSYTLVGDPTQEFVLPSPAPPVGLSALGGNAQVDLSWSASPDPNTTTRLYRAQSPSGPYTLITPTPVAGTFHTDPNVVNAQSYFYYASSVDESGFEGRISNYNSDCVVGDLPSSGPDCVWAVPLNPNPPQTPSGAMVSGDGSGVRLEVTWDPNPENDIESYIVVYGTLQGGPYPFTESAGSTATGLTVHDLTTGLDYYLRLSAKNTSGLESTPTAELHGVPLEYTGEAPPKFMESLTIVVTPGDANSLTLSWNAPTEDIYGGPTVIDSYAIYRETFPAFVPAPSNRIALISDPNVTSHIDVGAAAAPSDYYYLMNATNDRGFSSGLGFELPGGVDDLVVDIINGGTTLRFDWSAVTNDVLGGTTRISHYALYADGAPIPRAAIDLKTPLADNILTNSVEVPVNPAHLYFTLIVVDTRGNKSPF